jgi:20S proteasome subunit alpha 6
MRQQAMASKMVFNRPVPVNRLVSAIAESALFLSLFFSSGMLTRKNEKKKHFPEAQVNTQEYGRRPYGVGFLVIGLDHTGPHLYEFSPSGTSFEYFAVSIGARSQSAKTYLEKHFESFADCTIPSPSPFLAFSSSILCCVFTRVRNTRITGGLEDLIRHGLHALRETLQQDKELTTNNTSIGILGPRGVHEAAGAPVDFRILEGPPIEVYLQTMQPKELPPPPVSTSASASGSAAPPGGSDEDVQMSEQ